MRFTGDCQIDIGWRQLLSVVLRPVQCLCGVVIGSPEALMMGNENYSTAHRARMETDGSGVRTETSKSWCY